MKKYCVTPKDALLHISDEQGGCFLFQGKKGLGKALCAREIAARLLDCGVDRLDVHPDYLYLSPEGSCIKVEEMEKVKAFVSLVPAMAGVKVVIIDDSDTMTDSAQNTILKLLEDESGHVVIILVAHGKVLDTISSRSHIIRFNPLTKSELMEMVAEEESINMTALELSEGCPGLYVQMLAERDYISDVAGILRVLYSTSSAWKVFEAFHILKEKESGAFFEKYDRRFVRAFLSLIRRGYTAAIQGKLGIPSEYFMDVSKLGYTCSVEELLRKCSVLEKAEHGIERNTFNKNDFFQLVDDLCCTASYEYADRR